MTLEENKKWLSEALYGYTEGKFRDRFKGIILTETAMMKMGTVFGFLACHEELIQNFFDKMEWMNRHELVEVIHDKDANRSHKAPDKITELADDGTLFGFSFIFLHLTTETSHGFRGSRKLGLWNDEYHYGMNGAVIFHGFGNQNFTVTLDDNIGWSIHT